MADDRSSLSGPVRWITITGPLAFCNDCPIGTVFYNGDQDRDHRKALAFARRHARETGHSVTVERGQSLQVRP